MLYTIRISDNYDKWGLNYLYAISYTQAEEIIKAIREHKKWKNIYGYHIRNIIIEIKETSKITYKNIWKKEFNQDTEAEIIKGLLTL